MKSFIHLLCLFLLVTSVRATPGDPAGALRLILNGNSDTVVSLPLQRPPLIETSFASRSGNVLTFDEDVPTLPSGGAYVLVMTGALEGAILPITAIDGANATVESTPFDLSTLLPGDAAAIIPYWTLDTLFPGGQGVHASTSVLDRASEVLCFDDSTPGTDQAASARYFYLSGHPTMADGWYKVGNLTQTCGNHRLPPQHYFEVRHNVPESTELLLCGGVQLSRFNVPLQQRSANLAQDNLVALPIPVPVALASAGLIESGAFTASTSLLNRADELQVFDNTVIGQQKAASARYFYYSGGSRPVGWYRVGDTSVIANPTLLPGEGFTIRKQATPAPHTDLWKALPQYLQ
jgi:uncharacterized protein (TIGR02597 family)